MIMRTLVLYTIGLIVLCLCVVACASGPTPTPIVEQSIRVKISAANNQTQLVKDKKTAFYIDVEPSSLRGQTADVNVHGDQGIQCEPSEDDMWTWYCTGTKEVEAATVFADITGTFPAQTARYAVEVVAPTPTPIPSEEPSKAPIEAPTEEPTEGPTKAPTERPTEEPTEEPTKAPTKGPTKTPSDVCALVSLRPLIEGPAVDVEVEITSPGHCDMGLATTMGAGGTYSGDLTSKEMWILVYPTDGKYYPQTLDACQQIPSNVSGDNWETIVNFGGSPQQYDVVAVVTDADGEASQEFKRWLQTGCETGEFPGYLGSELPGGVTEVDAITVSTEELTEGPTQGPAPPVGGECPFDEIPFRTSIEGPPVDVEASITSIQNCADNLPMASSIPLSGTYSGDLTNRELWVLVYASDLKYYPQSSDACGGLSAGVTNGQWGEIIRLGRAGFPEAFHIVLVVTEIGSPASNDFHEYLDTGCSTGNYLGRVLLQPGVTELDSIIVHTR